MFTVPDIPHTLSSWIHSIYVVTFDIEFGQAVELRYPRDIINPTLCLESSTTIWKDFNLSDIEQNNICYSSFPDSNSAITGSTQFHFKMRLSKLNKQLKDYYSYYNTQTTQALNVDTQFIYGYVHFLQKKDSTLKRGYFQKSLVILSPLPFVEFFYHIVRLVGTNYFDNEKLLNLENVYNQTLKWPQLIDTIGRPLNLGIMGTNIAYYIPNKDDNFNSLHASLSPTTNSIANKMRMLRNKLPVNDNQTNSEGLLKNGLSNITDTSMTINASTSSYMATSMHGTPVTLMSPHQDYQLILTAFDLDLYRCFYPVLSDLQLLWEMILTCEPLIIMAQTPDACAMFVQSMISLIYPFKYNSDFRPFFTIHDPEFREYINSNATSAQSTTLHTNNNQNATKTNVILGVTNPFFAKSLVHWPNIVQLCGMSSSKSSDQISSLISSFANLNQNQQQTQQSTKIPFVDRLRFTNTEQLRPGLNTKLKPFLHKDRNFLTKILRSNKAHGSNRPHNVQNALIRRWLIELTQSFFMPLERYLTQLMPLHSKISPFKSPPELPEFDTETFLATIETSGPQLTTKVRGDWYGLYKKFFQSPNFSSWYNDRKIEIDRKLWSLHMESFLDINLPQAIKNKGEVEVVDMIIFLRRRLAHAVAKSHEYQFTCSNLDQFKAKLSELIDTLPEDLRTFFQQSSQQVL